MNGPEYALIVIFASLWLVPLALALLWERRYRNLVARLGRRTQVER